MLDNRKLLILVVTIALVGIISLFLYSSTIKPEKVSIGDIDESMVGKLVWTSGMIGYSRTLSDGSLSVELTDIQSGVDIRVYVPFGVYDTWAGPPLTPGTTIEVEGEVEMYADEVEISVNSAEGLRVVSGSVAPEFELWQVLESVEVLEHMNLTTEGIAYDVGVIESSGDLVGTAFVVTTKHENASYSLDCILFDADLTSVIEDGDRIRVTGVLEFYKNKGCWQLVLSEYDLGDENKTY